MGNAFDWSMEKNRQLIERRGVSFETVVSAMEQALGWMYWFTRTRPAILDSTFVWLPSRRAFNWFHS